MKHYFITRWTSFFEGRCNELLKCVPFTHQKKIWWQVHFKVSLLAYQVGTNTPSGTKVIFTLIWLAHAFGTRLLCILHVVVHCMSSFTDDAVLLSSPSSPNLVIHVWPGSCTVESLLISSCQIFQAAFIFKKWASQQVLHGLLWGPAFTGCICCISIAPFTQVGFAAAHPRAESVEGLPQLPLRFMARC